MKRLAAIIAMLLLVGCTLPEIPTDIVSIVTLTPTVGVTAVPTETPVPTATLTPTPTETPEDFIPTPTSEVADLAGCEFVEFDIICRATTCQVRNDHIGGDEVRAYTVPNGTVVKAYGLCTFDNNPVFPDWFYLGYQETIDTRYWAVNANGVWEKLND